MPRDYLQEASSVIFGDSVVLADAFTANPGQVIGNLLRALKHEKGLSSAMIRKAAAYALGQLGYRETLAEMRERYSTEGAPGVKDALIASMTAIKLAPSEQYSQSERQKIIEDVYNRRRQPDWT